MRAGTYTLASILILIGSVNPLQAQPVGPPAHGLTSDLTQDDVVDALDNGEIDEVRALGLLVFSTPFNRADGHGDGPFDPNELPPLAFGHRPTLQGNGQFLRVNGLDAQSCNECHTIVSHATLPPTLGIGGVGGMVQNAIISPSLIDVADSFDDRVHFVPGHDPSLPLEFDGVADYNGRIANPPFLFGGGGVELVGKEMTADLQYLLAEARLAPAGTVTSLDTHGVHFGSITTTDGVGNVALDVEGIGPEDTSGLSPEEILVMRPFGRKGENFSMRDFDRGAMQFHFGIQPVEVVGEDADEDGDGTIDEVTVAEMSALHVFDVNNPRPIKGEQNGRTRHGRRKFRQVGCVNCHIPKIRTHSRFLPLAHPEVAHDPDANVYAYIDLVEVGFRPDPHGPGVIVPLFADLKRHAMGDGLAETFELAEIANDHFTTARLWGIGDTAPYLHDGRATTLVEAIAAHGGEAQGPRDAFLALPQNDQNKVIEFLQTLLAPESPNEDLLDH